MIMSRVVLLSCVMFVINHINENTIHCLFVFESAWVRSLLIVNILRIVS